MKNLFQNSKNESATKSQTIWDEKSILVGHLFEEILSSGATLRVKVTGGSMCPFLRAGEVVRIRKESPKRLFRGDLILFKNDRLGSTLHRIIRKRKAADGTIRLQTKGDACHSLDNPVASNNVLGKVWAIERMDFKGKRCLIDLTLRSYRVRNRVIAIYGYFRMGMTHMAAKINRFRKTEA